MKCRKLTKRAFRDSLRFGRFVRDLFNAFMSLSDVMYVASYIDIDCDIPHANILIKKELKNKED